MLTSPARAPGHTISFLRNAIIFAAARRAGSCHLVLFRHILKTGGTSVRELFRKLSSEQDGLRGGAGWRAAVPYAEPCASFNGWRRTVLSHWLADRRANISSADMSPNLFIEYHVPFDSAHDFYQDLHAARSVQSDQCRVIAVALIRQPEGWVRSMFKHDLRRYGGNQLNRHCTATQICDTIERWYAIWSALAAWNGTSPARMRVRSYAESAATAQLQPLLRSLNASLISDDATVTHADSQSIALYWRVQQQKPGGEARARTERFALHAGSKTSYDLIGTTEALDIFISEIFRRTGHTSRPPSTTPLNHYGASEMVHLSLDAALRVSSHCATLLRVLDGAPDAAVFDALARRSSRDRALWEAARRTQVAPLVLLPVHEIGARAFGWVRRRLPEAPPWPLTNTTSLLSSSREPWWDSYMAAFPAPMPGSARPLIRCSREPRNEHPNEPLITHGPRQGPRSTVLS